MNNLRCANDIVLFARNKIEITEMNQWLHTEATKTDLKINFQKKKLTMRTILQSDWKRNKRTC